MAIMFYYCHIFILFKGGVTIIKNFLIWVAVILLSIVLFIAPVPIIKTLKTTVLENTSKIVLSVKKHFYKYDKLVVNINYLSEEEESLYNFIEKNLTAKNQGLLTNLLGKQASGDLPGGSETLSESVGLLMQYALKADSQSLFDKQLLFLNEVYTVKDGFILWKVGEDNSKITSSNALIDDLRVSTALISAYEKWRRDDYLKFAQRFSKAMLKYNVKDSLPVDFYDYKVKQASKSVSLRYLDIEGIEKLTGIDGNWKPILDKTRDLVEGSYINKDKVFFYEEYDTATGNYIKVDKVNMVNQLIAVENMIKADIIPKETLDWIKYYFNWYGFIVAEYNVSDKSKSSDFESPAIYALCSRIFYMTGDYETAQKCHRRMLENQRVADKTSKLYGGYAYVQTGEAYSFDNLQALLTVRYLNNKLK